MRIVNIPKKGEGKVIGIFDGNRYEIYNDNENTIMCTIENNKPEYVAQDIACLIEAARDRGYQYALEHIRKELGIKDWV